MNAIEKHTKNLNEDFNDLWENLILDLEISFTQNEMSLECFNTLVKDIVQLQKPLIKAGWVLDKKKLYKELKNERTKEALCH